MQKNAWYELVLKPWTISCTPRSGRPGQGRKRPLVWATSRPTIGIDVLIVPHPRHALLALWVALNTRMGPPWRPQNQKCVSEALAAGVQAGAAQA